MPKGKPNKRYTGKFMQKAVETMHKEKLNNKHTQYAEKRKNSVYQICCLSIIIYNYLYSMAILSKLILKRMPYKILAKELDVPLYRNIGLALRDIKTTQILIPCGFNFIELVDFQKIQLKINLRYYLYNVFLKQS